MLVPYNYSYLFLLLRPVLLLLLVLLLSANYYLLLTTCHYYGLPNWSRSQAPSTTPQGEGAFHDMPLLLLHSLPILWLTFANSIQNQTTPHHTTWGGGGHDHVGGGGRGGPETWNIYIYIYIWCPPSQDLPFLAFSVSKNNAFPWKN